MDELLKPGKQILHYKGGIYLFLGVANVHLYGFKPWQESISWHPVGGNTIIAIGRLESDLTPCIIYRNSHGEEWVRIMGPSHGHPDQLGYYAHTASGQVWLRPLAEFTQEVSKGVRRFTEVSCEQSNSTSS